MVVDVLVNALFSVLCSKGYVFVVWEGCLGKGLGVLVGVLVRGGGRGG